MELRYKEEAISRFVTYAETLDPLIERTLEVKTPRLANRFGTLVNFSVSELTLLCQV